MVIQHNISSLNAWRNTAINSNGVSKNLEKLSSGFRVNRAADDAAGLAISEKMRGQIRGLSQAQKNISDGISLTQTIDGAMQTDHEMLQRIRELLVQASNDTYDESDRQMLQGEIDQLMQEIDDLSYRAEFNGLKALRTNWVETVKAPPTGTTVPVVVMPGEEFAYGYVEVQEGDNFYIQVKDLTISSAEWPDINIIAPNGDKFGFSWTYLDSSAPDSTTSAASCDEAKYNGWATDDERYDFTGVTAGKWIIQIRNYGNKPSGFNLTSDKIIVPYGNSTDGGFVSSIKEPGPVYIQAGANSNETITIPISTIDSYTLSLRDNNVKAGLA